ncbi:hypothetical protein Lupro_03030 [Lutibacter profundi]|uniref:Orc1-like AAA ATPase domain-containing protein n=1 Tax=Lutibacter profundi TaxID=1622118 RepID=A0A0X8G573_9FLAO|nr:hypothetical protein [Lutibacter profundi]AMC10289.1 hypothetical protein Lupro_03030 [Lutibacter profundi]
MRNTDLIKVLKFIEENIRITDQTSIEYLDPKGHIERLDSKQNQIIFGRRGSGKSLLLKSLKETKPEILCLTINLEDFKDISFPNSITQVLRSLIKQLKKEVEGEFSFFKSNKKWRARRKITKQFDKILKKLEQRLKQPDSFDESIREKKGAKVSAEAKGSYTTTSTAVRAEQSKEIETSKSFKIDKLNILKNELPDLKELINETCSLLDKSIFLVLDDFYFIRKSDQPYFADFFHRLCKNTGVYLKVATIKHRTSLYIQGETYVGMEIGHDAQALNLDYSLENFNSLVRFMRDLLKHVNEKVGVNINYNNILTENAFKFLCLASGGVPRDFFTLFISLGNKMIDGNKSISKPNVIDCSIENLPNKLEAFKTDTADEKEVLEHYLQYIREEIISNKKHNAFLIPNAEILKYSQINQAIKELVDLRLIHLVNSNTSSAPSDGLRYSAYMVDIGLFPNANPRDFKQVQPGEKDDRGRDDKIRSAPKVHLNKYQEFINELNLNKTLTLTD